MKYSYPLGYLELKNFMKESGVPGCWKLRRDGKHRQFLAGSGEILNYRDDSKSVWFQGREHGPLHKWFASARAAKLAARRKTERRSSPMAAVMRAQPDRGGPPPRAPSTRTPAPPPAYKDRLAATNERRRRVADISTDVSRTATAELNVPPQTQEAGATYGSPGTAQVRLAAETKRRMADFQASPRSKWYRALEDERAERQGETARVVSTLLTEALRRAEKAMTLPKLSLAFAAISVEIVSGRRQPDLRNRIERILLDVSEDEFYEDCLDEYDPDFDDE